MSQREGRSVWRPVAFGSVLLAAGLALGWSLGLSNDEPGALPAPTTTATPTARAGTPDPSHRPTDSPPAPPASTTDPVTTYDSACGLSGGTTELLTAPPEGVEWQNVDGWYFPVSATAGPGLDARSCFARTPSGALLATYTISMLVDGLAEDFVTVVTEQTGSSQSRV